MFPCFFFIVIALICRSTEHNHIKENIFAKLLHIWTVRKRTASADLGLFPFAGEA